MNKRKRPFIIIDTNCDCSSDTIARHPTRYMWGPRCPNCNKILGLMEWDDVDKVMAFTAWEALEIYRLERKE